MPDALKFDLTGRRIWIAGHAGMVGQALMRRLRREDCELLTVPRSVLDLRRQAEVEDWLAAARPDAIIVAAARVGGILANHSLPADFLFDNLAIAQNVIHGAWRTGVRRLLYLGSSCIYPRHAAQPVAEDALLTGALEPTNEWYAVAKIAGLKLCDAYRRQHGCDFISAMPTNLYGYGDNFDPLYAHVLPALLARIDQARLAGSPSVPVWGSGRPRREFLFVDDLADALVLLLRRYDGPGHINVGTGEDVSIAELATMIAAEVGYHGRFAFDADKPDGTPRKLLDVRRIQALGWRHATPLPEGIRLTYDWYRQQLAAGGLRGLPSNHAQAGAAQPGAPGQQPA